MSWVLNKTSLGALSGILSVSCSAAPTREPTLSPERAHVVKALASCAMPEARIIQKHTARQMVDGTIAGHAGVDVASEAGSSVIAMADGVVVNAQGGNSSTGQDRGGIITIYHEVSPGRDVEFWLYAHVDNIQVRRGDHVKTGTPIAQVWMPDDGREWVAHVHVERVDATLAIELRDPMKEICGCLSQGGRQGLVLPIPC